MNRPFIVTVRLEISKKSVAFQGFSRYNIVCVAGCGSVWLERRLREAEAAGSNPVTPIYREMTKMA